MKLIVLFVGLCVSVGVLCVGPDQVQYGFANPSSSGNSLASSNGRQPRMFPLIPVAFGALLVGGAASIAVQNSMVNNMNSSPHQASVSESFVSANKLVNDLFNEFSNKNELCHREQNRRRRQLNSHNANCLIPVLAIVGQTYFNQIERIAEGLRSGSDTITTDVSNDNRHAVDDYTTIAAPANQNHPQPIDLIVTMRATLTYDNTAHYMRAPAIHPSITERMQQLDWYHGGNRNTNDERGHLLADSLGGPSLPWNFVPQSPAVNRGVEIRGDLHVAFCWWDLEGEIRRTLQENQDHYVAWTITIAYGGLPNSRRPTGFMISVREMTSDHRFVRSRMFMIPNVPSDACTNPNHPFWTLQY